MTKRQLNFTVRFSIILNDGNNEVSKFLKHKDNHEPINLNGINYNVYKCVNTGSTNENNDFKYFWDIILTQIP